MLDDYSYSGDVAQDHYWEQSGDRDQRELRVDPVEEPVPAWRESVEALTPGSLGRELVSMAWGLNSTKRRVCHMAADYDDKGEWLSTVQPSAAHWIAKQLHIAIRTAREWIQVGHMCKWLPQLDHAFQQGELSYAKVRVISSYADEDNIDELIHIAKTRPASRLSAALAKHLFDTENPDDRDDRHRHNRNGNIVTDPGGMTGLHFWMPPAESAYITAGLEKQMKLAEQKRKRTNPDDPYPSLGQQRADALLAIFTQQIDFTTEVILHVRGDGNTTNDGTPLTDNAVINQLPNSYIRALISDAEGRPINASSRQRHPTTRQERVAHERHKGQCTNCGATTLLHYHHNPAYNITKHTIIEELEPLCAPCHHAHHRNDPSHKPANHYPKAA